MLLLLACTAGDSSEKPSAEPVWSTVLESAGALSGVWGTGPDDVFIVGGAEAGEAWHYDGAAWTAMTLPEGTGLLVWVYGFAPDDVFAVGVDGAAVHWDGADWSTLPTDTTEDLWGVFGFAPDDVWVVGGTADEDAPYLLHWDGAAFSPWPFDPAQNDRGATSLFKVWGIGDTLFSVGDKGLLVQWTGTDWVRISGGAEANDDLVSLWGDSPDHIVAVGGRSNGRIATWDGTTWDTVKPTAIGGLNGVWMDADGVAHVAGIYGYVGRWDGELHDETVVTTADLHAVWGDGAGRIYAVGGSFAEPWRGVALVRTEP